MLAACTYKEGIHAFTIRSTQLIAIAPRAFCVARQSALDHGASAAPIWSDAATSGARERIHRHLGSGCVARVPCWRAHAPWVHVHARVHSAGVAASAASGGGARGAKRYARCCAPRCPQERVGSNSEGESGASRDRGAVPRGLLPMRLLFAQG